MQGGRKRYAVTLASVIFILILHSAPLLVQAQSVPFEDTLLNGPYIEKLVFKHFVGGPGQSDVGAALRAMIADEVDIVVDNLYVWDLPGLAQIEEIEVQSSLRNGYGHLTINCEKYPFNITAFRRALAFALDKETISNEVWEGESRPHDCVVPRPNPSCIEGYIPYCYYSALPEIGNQLLDDAGFLDIDADGYREAPDGTKFEVLVEVGLQSELAPDIGVATVEAFESLHIQSDWILADFYGMIYRLDNHLDYDIAFFGFSWPTYGLTWLANQYGSEYADIKYGNNVNFRNETFDSWIPQLLYSTDWDKVQEAVFEMQKILAYECPRIVVYVNNDFRAFRTDVFDGHVYNDLCSPVNTFTIHKVHRKMSKGGPWDGTFRIAATGIGSSFNHMTPQYRMGGPFEPNHMTLLIYGPDHQYHPYLASRLPTILTNAEDPSVPKGQTRVIYDLITNATWSDGTPITAEDVAFSLNYYFDAIAYGALEGVDFWDLRAAYAVSPYRLVMDFGTVSWWHMISSGDTIIMPKHILEDYPIERWEEYQPVTEIPFVVSGPFEVTGFVPGGFVEMTARADWAYGIDRSPGEDATTTTPTGNGEPEVNNDGFLVGGLVGAASVIAGGYFVMGKSSPAGIKDD